MKRIGLPTLAILAVILSAVCTLGRSLPRDRAVQLISRAMLFPRVHGSKTSGRAISRERTEGICR